MPLERAQDAKFIFDPKSPLVVVAVATFGTSRGLAGQIVERVEPRIRHLIRLSGAQFPAPNYLTARNGSETISAAFQRCQRAVLISEMRGGGSFGTVTSWHHHTMEASDNGAHVAKGLSALRLTACHEQQDFYHLPLWLEDDLPPEGIDFIGFATPVNRLTAGDRRRGMALVVSATTGILWRVVREMAHREELERAA